MKNKIRAVVIEDFTGQIIDPAFDKSNLLFGDMVKALKFTRLYPISFQNEH